MKLHRLGPIYVLTIILPFLAALPGTVRGQSATPASGNYLALPLTAKAARHPKIQDRYGVPFVQGTLNFSSNAPATVPIGGQVKRIFLLGMTEPPNIHCWMDPRDYSIRFFIGDELGDIRLNYADGSTETYPLVLGESIWWGQAFYQYPEPFPTDARLRQALAAALRVYPPTPVKDGRYVAVITAKPVPLQSITFTSSPAKQAVPVIDGITVEPDSTNEISGAIAAPAGNEPAEFERFIRKHSLCSAGELDGPVQSALAALHQALYSSDENYSRGPVKRVTPPGYAGPGVSFAGDRTAQVLENAFRCNVQDIFAKLDTDGMYHTSTAGAISWNGAGFGTFRTNAGTYYATSWCRDMGRSLQELTELGYTNDARLCADYCLRTARLWEDIKYKGQVLPPHWGRIANRPQNAPPFENDGHGLVSLFLYKLWQRLPDRDDWLRARWPDVQAAGDWILWQFDHPEISGATNGVLHTTGESAAGNGYSVYADYACMNALLGLSQMADAIGQTQAAERWRARAEKMRRAMADQYMIEDPKYGRVWTLADAGWPGKGTVLGPEMLLADYSGFAPEDDNPDWRPVNEAAYQRMIDTYQPFGFCGQAMGYGQGFMTESALLLDRMQDATKMLDWTAKQIYDPRFGCFIVPEGVQVDPTGKFWYRAGDLGNGVQEAEIIKTLRLVIGVDDTRPDRLRFFPRLPYGWNTTTVSDYPALCGQEGKVQLAHLDYRLKRAADGMSLTISADRELGPVPMRLGPFDRPPVLADIRVNGKCPAATREHSGDSWWVRFTAPVGPR